MVDARMSPPSKIGTSPDNARPPRSASWGLDFRDELDADLENPANQREAIMATKTTFTPEEWDLLMTGVMSSGVAVTAADPSGLWGLMKESFASAKSLVEAKANPQSNDLIKAIVADFESSETRTRVRAAMKKRFESAAAADVKARSIETLQEASALLDTKAPEEATSVKTWMRTIGQSVAEAAPEGGMFGFGGVQVSESEKATLAELSKALRLPA